jgi:lipoprotein-anchoring transpeptidase ErfK/SrfK
MTTPSLRPLRVEGSETRSILETIDLPEPLSRRAFLQAAGFGLLALGVPVVWRGRPLGLPAGQLGRVAEAKLDAFRAPSFGAARVRSLARDDLLLLQAAVVGDRYPEHNRVWYEIDRLGFVHSGGIQPVRNNPATPLAEVPWTGLLAEVCTPFVDSHLEPDRDSARQYRYYFETTHWVTGVQRDAHGLEWYRILDDKLEREFFARAENLRPIPLAELTPISSDVPADEKRIEVSMAQQWVQCYEGGDLVFSTRVSTGQPTADKRYETPRGDFAVNRKRASRHMAEGNLATGYDLPGVPWVAYLTADGISFHGTYWHNDFGAPRSHGCVNLTPQAAKWLYRWTRPVVPMHEQQLWSGDGTKVLIKI